MNRILLGVLAALVVAVGFTWWRAHELTKDLAASEANNQHLQQAVQDINAEVAAGIAERERLDRITKEAIRRRNDETRAKDVARAELKRIQSENEDLRAYLGSGIPSRVVGWLWLPACREDQGGAGEAPGEPVGAHAEACKPAQIVTHEEGWIWCGAVEMALDSCNADKAAISRWAESGER